MKYYIIVGEASGDLHASNLMKEILLLDQHAEFRFWGGDKMAALVGEPVKHIKDLAFMGFIEVLMNIRTISKNLKFCKNDIQAYKPDCLILVDYPGFNLRIAAFANEIKIPVHYYISPQVWAWKQSRVHKIKKIVDQMYVILPFEEAFYKKFDYKVNFVGHPLVDAIQQFQSKALSKDDFFSQNNLNDLPVLAILPGSRVQEIKVKLPIMLEAAKKIKKFQIIVAGAPNQSFDFYQSIIQDKTVKVLTGQTYDILNQATLAIVTSGTATLETALFKVPQVVCYKANSISYQIAKRLVKIKYISLVNLIADKEVVKELIQGDLTVENVFNELNAFIESPEKMNKILEEYNKIENILGKESASQKTARLIYDNLQK